MKPSHVAALVWSASSAFNAGLYAMSGSPASLGVTVFAGFGALFFIAMAVRHD